MVLQKDGASAGVVEEDEDDEEELVMSTSGWLRRTLTGMPIASSGRESLAAASSAYLAPTTAPRHLSMCTPP